MRAWMLGLVLCACSSTQVRGVVFVDTNRDGVRQDDERGVGNVVVAVERQGFARTGSDGHYELESDVMAGLAWVRVPDGYRPGPVWRFFDGSEEVDLPIVPLTGDEAAGPLSFVVAADSHVTADPTMQDPWDPADLMDAIDQATSLPEPPRFFTIVGDITQGNKEAEFARLGDVLSGIDVPWVPVPGNHDWYDGGATYRRTYGIDNYSFDIGNVHFVVWDTNLSDADQIAFVRAELAHVDDAMIVVALGHASPSDAVADAMEDAGVDYIFSGHWHANRRLQRGAMVEWGTQTFVMGGIDQAPSGYRVVTFADDVPFVEHRERMVHGHLDLVAPHAGSCAPATGFPVVAAAALDATVPAVTMRLDCGPEQPLAYEGGWSFRGQAPALSAGTHTLSLTATTPSGRSLEKHIAFEVCSRAASTLAFTDWPQHAGGPTHTNQRTMPAAPPLAVRWTATIGGTISLGSPTVAGQLALISITDFGSGDSGGVVALELATGAERWRYVTPFPAVASPAVADGVVVVATKNGELHGIDLATGGERWRQNVGADVPTFEAGLWAPPTIADGLVYAALQGNFTALDVQTGTPVWARDPEDPEYTWLGSLAAVAVADGSAIASFNRSLGLQSWSASTGVTQWTINDGRGMAVNAAPVVAGGTAYVISSAGVVSAIDAATAATRWTMSVTPRGNSWDYTVTATPALSDTRLFVGTNWGELVALDRASGAVMWRVQGTVGPINYTHYRDAAPGFPSSPVVTGDIVWIGTLSGDLVAHAADDGRVLWSTSLGAPIASAPTPTGTALVVATYDGSVRLLAPAQPAAPGPAMVCQAAPAAPAPSSGGCAAGGGGIGIGLLALRLRRRRPGDQPTAKIGS